MIRAVLIDDEPYAREELRFLLEKYSDEIEIIAECANAIEGVRVVNAENPDVLFLDIQMPGVNGFEMLSMIDSEKMPYVVFCTAYDEYAIKAFEERALDYLLKPIEQGRLDKTVDKLISSVKSGNIPDYEKKEITRIPCSLKNVIKLVQIEAVESVQSDITGVHVITAEDTFFTDLTLKAIDNGSVLHRCHKQHLVNLDCIDEIRMIDTGGAVIVTKSGKEVPVSRRHLKELKDTLGM